MTEFAALLQAGADPLKLDSYMKDLGFPVGPVTLIDEVFFFVVVVAFL